MLLVRFRCDFRMSFALWMVYTTRYGYTNLRLHAFMYLMLDVLYLLSCVHTLRYVACTDTIGCHIGVAHLVHVGLIPVSTSD